LPELRGLIREAAEWLQTRKRTDQWAKPWPTREARDQRLLAGLKNGKTWIVWDGDNPAATVTVAAQANPAVWSKPACECDLSERAVYAHRLIAGRNYSGWGLGAELINWAGLRGRHEYGAKWVRIDVWSSNGALHDYYQKRGFEPCGTCADSTYPSGALFQKPVSAIRKPGFPQFTETLPSPGSTVLGDLVDSA
jgi:GNAT superfamily N-acetyltransferase